MANFSNQSNVNGTNADDVITGTVDADTLSGSAGNDVISGYEGDDKIDGGSGLDYIYGYSGNDTIYGGTDRAADVLEGDEGDDTYRLIDSKDIINDTEGNNKIVLEPNFKGTLDLGQYSNANFTEIDATAVNNSLTLTAGTSGMTIRGGKGKNTINGGAGTDTLIGSISDDTIYGGDDLVSDSLQGGAGNDTYIIKDTNDTIVDTSSSNTLKLTPGFNTSLDLNTTYEDAGITKIDAQGNSNGLTITANGSTATNILGGNGNDTLTGGALNDSLFGGDGSDVLDGGEGTNTLNGGNGDDTYIFNGSATKTIINDASGIDKIELTSDYSGSDSVSLANYSIIENIDASNATPDTSFKLTGNRLNNFIIGSEGTDEIKGEAGNDTLYGRGGRNILSGGAGNDTYLLDGTEEPESTIVDTNSSQLDQVILLADNDGKLAGKASAYYKLSSYVESLDGSDIQGTNLTLEGTSGADTLIGGTAHDSLIGGSGHDTLYGRGGNNTLEGGAGNDTYLIDGGETSTTIIETNNSISVTDVLKTVADQDLKFGGNDDASVSLETYNEIEALDAREIKDTKMTLAGNDLNNTIYGGDGGNSIDGGLGNDTIYGGSSQDTLFGGLGANKLYGGDGNDVYQLNGLETGKTIIGEYGKDLEDEIELLADGDGKFAGEDTASFSIAGYSSIENLDASSITDTNMTLTGNARNNLIKGSDADDTINSGAGHDTIVSGLGADKLVGGAGNDEYRIRGDQDKTIVETSSGGNDTVVLEAEVDGSFANSAADSIFIHMDSLATKAKTIENVDASSISNSVGTIQIRGNSLHNKIVGSQVDDIIDGVEGNDTIWGGDGNDTIFGGVGNDTIFGGDGNDTLTSGIGNDTLTGGAGNDSFEFAEGHQKDFITGTDSGDRINIDESTGITTKDVLFYFDKNGNFCIDYTYGSKGKDIITIANYDGNTTVNIGDDSIKIGDVVDRINNDGLNTKDKNTQSEELGDLWGEETDRSGNDTYLIYGTETVKVAEKAAGGNDTLELVPDGSNNFNAVTNLFPSSKTVSIETLSRTANTIENIDGRNVASDLTLIGNNLDNTIYGGTGYNSITGGKGNDVLVGSEGQDNLSGGDGDDTLSGKGGKNYLSGGAGNDTYLVDGTETELTIVDTNSSQFDQVILVADQFGQLASRPTAYYKLSNYVEKIDGSAIEGTNLTLEGTSGADIIIGGKANDSLIGGSGHDTLYGLGGNNILEGGAGNDTYLVDGSETSTTIIDTLGITDTLKMVADVNLKYKGDDEKEVSLESYESVEALDAREIKATKMTLIGNDANNIIYGGDGGNSIDGGLGNDTIYGGTSQDTIFGGLGANKLYGGSGDDIYQLNGLEGKTIIGEYGNDSGDEIELLADGDGKFAGKDSTAFSLAAYSSIENLDASSITSTNMTLTGNNRDNNIYGSAMADVINAGIGDDYIFAGAGNDSLIGETGDDYILGAGGDDTVYGGVGNDTLIGGAVSILGGDGSDTIYGGDGDDLIYGSDTTTTDVDNGSSDTGDVLYGENGNDTIYGGYGDDMIYGGAGNNLIYGNDDNDVIYASETKTGATGVNKVFGGNGDDTIYNYSGYSTIYGGEGNDLISTKEYANKGNNLIYAEAGDDAINGYIYETIYAGDGEDTITMVEGGNTLDGGAGNDNITGGTRADIADTIYGGSGNDTIVGRGGNDLIIGGTGYDLLTGGNNSDNFYFSEGDEHDTITVTDATDKITINPDTGITREDLLFYTDSDGNFYIDYTNDDIGYDVIKILNPAGNTLPTLNIGDNTLNLNSIKNNLGEDYTGLTSEEILLLQQSNKTAQNSNLDQYWNVDPLVGHSNGELAPILEDTFNYAPINYDTNNTYKLYGIEMQPFREKTDGGNDTLKLMSIFGDDSFYGFTYLYDPETANGIISQTQLATIPTITNQSEATVSIDALSKHDDTIENIDASNIVNTALTLAGNNLNNTITGGGSSDTIFGGNGNDYLKGGKGNDTIYGGEGNDTISGADAINTNGGNYIFRSKTVYGAPYAGTFFNHPSAPTYGESDVLVGGNGDDTYILNGDEMYWANGFSFHSSNALVKTAIVEELNGGTDTLKLAAKEDGSYGLYVRNNIKSIINLEDISLNLDTIENVDGSAITSYRPGELEDYNEGITTSLGYNIICNNLNNVVYGTQVDDIVTAGQGNDTLFGNAGNDWLYGGIGDDYLSGGAGADTYAYNGSDWGAMYTNGHDVITETDEFDDVFISTSAVTETYLSTNILFYTDESDNLYIDLNVNSSGTSTIKLLKSGYNEQTTITIDRKNSSVDTRSSITIGELLQAITTSGMNNLSSQEIAVLTTTNVTTQAPTITWSQVPYPY